MSTNLPLAWEYKVVPGVTLDSKSWDAFGEALNFYGGEGWELVSVIALDGIRTGYMKREKKSL